MSAFPLVLALAPAAGHADNSVWFDPHDDCGHAAAFARSGRAADLPGCSGRLPKNAPAVEVVLHDAKRRLVEAEELLAKNKLDKLEPLLTQTEAGLAKAPPVNPDVPDRWEQAEPLYRREIAALRNRRTLAPHLDKLRATHAAAVEADKTRNNKDVEGGPAEAVKAAGACVAAFSEVRAAGLDMTVMVELDKDRPQPLQDAGAECERIRRSAEALARAQEQAARARRAQWRKLVKGDRRKTFDEHPTALPGFDGAPQNWRAIATVPEWTYATPAGHERYTFKGNKLTGRTVGK